MSSLRYNHVKTCDYNTSDSSLDRAQRLIGVYILIIWELLLSNLTGLSSNLTGLSSNLTELSSNLTELSNISKC